MSSSSLSSTSSPSDPPSSAVSPSPPSTTSMASTDPLASSSSTTTSSTSLTSSSMPPSTSTSSTTSSSSTTTSTTSTSSSDTSEPTTSTPSSTTDPPTTTTSSDPPTTTTTSTTSTQPPPPTTTTTHRAPTTTFQSIVFISTTDNNGSPTSTAPSAITSTFTSTRTDGGLVTVTQIVANPTLIPNSSRHKGNGFFGNTGAVAAVFVLVGLAAASIALWILFAVRRRRRQSRIERETAAAALQAAANHRPPLDDDDDPQQQHFTPSALEMSQHRSSSGFASTYLGPRLSYHDDPDHPDAFNPYADYGYTAPGPMAQNASRDGYTIARTSSPPVAYLNNTSHDRSRRASASGSLGSTNGPESHIMGNHSATHSGASYEPLMASYYRQSSGSGQLPGSPVVTTSPAAAVPPRTPPAGPSQLLVDDREPTEAHSMFTSDDRLDPGLRQRQREAESASMKDLRDDEDYSRPVLGVRNLP